MGERYEQLSLEERCTIARLREAGQSIRQVAAALDRPPSTISRELKRNAGHQVGYQPSYAQLQARARRWTGSRLEHDEELRELVLGQLAAGWSPEQIAGRLRLERGRQVISYESIYRFIYAQIRRTQDFSWRRYLPRSKFKRGRRGQSGGSPVKLLKMRRSISERPPAADDRQTLGHWEADYMLFAEYGHNILVAHERKTRLTLIAKLPNRRASPTANALAQLIGAWPEAMRSTVTFDNGTEFAKHYQLNRIGLKTYFCDPKAPWQKGGVENTIGRLRRYLPRKTNLADLSAHEIDAIARRYNNTPRKCLDYQTPAEACLAPLLHFECESTGSLFFCRVLRH
jgi:IS30 family transposase